MQKFTIVAFILCLSIGVLSAAEKSVKKATLEDDDGVEMIKIETFQSNMKSICKKAAAEGKRDYVRRSIGQMKNELAMLGEEMIRRYVSDKRPLTLVVGKVLFGEDFNDTVDAINSENACLTRFIKVMLGEVTKDNSPVDDDIVAVMKNCTLVITKDDASYLMLTNKSPRPITMNTLKDLATYGCVKTDDADRLYNAIDEKHASNVTSDRNQPPEGKKSKVTIYKFVTELDQDRQEGGLFDQYDSSQGTLQMWVDIGTMFDIVFFLIFYALLGIMILDMVNRRCQMKWAYLTPTMIKMGKFEKIFGSFKNLLKAGKMVAYFGTHGRIYVERKPNHDDKLCDEAFEIFTGCGVDKVTIFIQDDSDGAGKIVDVLLARIIKNELYKKI